MGTIIDVHGVELSAIPWYICTTSTIIVGYFAICGQNWHMTLYIPIMHNMCRELEIHS